MKSTATSKGGLYRAYVDADDGEDEIPTEVGLQLEDALGSTSALREPVAPNSAPNSTARFIQPIKPSSFFPPDDPNRVVTPAAIKTFNTRVRASQAPPALSPPRLGDEGGFGFGWMLGLAFMSACTVFVWLWFVARWFVH